MRIPGLGRSCGVAPYVGEKVAFLRSFPRSRGAVDAKTGLNGDAPRRIGLSCDYAACPKMKLLSCFKVAAAASLCAAVVGCASGVDSTPTVVRTPPPQNYQTTITNYLAFKIRNPPKNAEVKFGPPEPGACALGGYVTSSRGWVVPVAYATRTGEATGKETIRINAKQYYFWFLGDTLAGVTPRIELCPGVGSGFDSPVPDPPAAALVTTGLPTSAQAEAQRREEAGAGAEGSKRGTAQAKPKSTSATKKTGTSAAKAPAKKKTGTSPSKPKPS